MSVLEEPVVGNGDHVVQFYARDDELITAVAGFLGAGLQGGDMAVMACTPEHRFALDAVMAAAGVDVASAYARGDYISVDPGEALSALMVDGRPDREHFMSTVGGVVEAAVGAGRRVRAFGELVSMLWEQGNVTAAIELESLWNELAQRHTFSMYCAYRSDAFSAADADACEAVCRHHSRVIQADHSSPFDAGMVSPRAARFFLTKTLEDWGRADLVDAGALIVSELATNSVLHARSPFTVSISVRSVRSVGVVGDTVRISVRDASQILPRSRAYGLESGTGRGLHLVAATSSRWGAEVRDDGKTVWAELDAPVAPSAV